MVEDDVMPYHYHPYFCEENAYLNCAVLAAGRAAPSMLFIFGAGAWVPMLHQRAAPTGYAIRWDYHVVGVAADGTIVDPDSRLGPEIEAAHYLTVSFPRYGVTDEERPRFRIVPWDRARDRFGSDRSHMRNAEGGWRSPPPSWPPINPQHHRLPELIAKEDNEWGPVLDLPALRARLTAHP